MTPKEVEHELIDAGYTWEQGLVSGYWVHKKTKAWFTDWMVQSEPNEVMKQLRGTEKHGCDYSQ